MNEDVMWIKLQANNGPNALIFMLTQWHKEMLNTHYIEFNIFNISKYTDSEKKMLNQKIFIFFFKINKLIIFGRGNLNFTQCFDKAVWNHYNERRHVWAAIDTWVSSVCVGTNELPVLHTLLMRMLQI